MAQRTDDQTDQVGEAFAGKFTFENWDTIPNIANDMLFYSLQFGATCSITGITFTFISIPPQQPDHADLNEAISALATARVTVPIHQFKSMIDVTMSSYRALFGEDPPDSNKGDKTEGDRSDE